MYNENKQVTVVEAVKTIEAQFAGSNHAKKYTRGIMCIMEAFQEHCDERGIVVLEKDVILRFMAERYDVHPKRTNNKNVHRRAMNLLLTVSESREIKHHYSPPRIIPAQFAVPVNRLLDELRRDFKAETTVERYHQQLHILTVFFDEQGVKSPNELTLVHHTQFIKTAMTKHGKQHIAHQLRTMRWFLRSMHEAGDIPEDFSHKLPQIHNATHQTRLPSAFKPDEVEKVLSVVDRNSPVGKRDYAIILLAAKLGLRSGDIRQLHFGHIDWENNVISLVQNKTGNPLVLPLLPEVGWALIDYIKHGRPVSDSPEIFVRQVAPHVPMRYYDTLLVKYLQKAEIPYERMRHHGMHALRHSFASNLLEQQIPIDIIQESMGHTSPETTQVYLSVDVKQLKSCSLEVPHAEKD